MRQLPWTTALIASGALALAACGQKQEEAAAPPPVAPAATPAPAAPPAAPLVEARYSCSNGKTVSAVYDNSDPAKGKATLTIDGKPYVVTVAMSGSGARYTGETAPTPERRLTWWTKGDEATWYESLPSAGDAQGLQPVADCKKADAAG